MSIEREPFENYGLIAEAAGREPKGVPMTEDQAYYLNYCIDPMIDLLINNMDEEIKRRRKSDEYQRRTVNKI